LLHDFKADAIAGLTVAVVALPLSMAFAIASGLSPARGRFTAIVGGLLVSAIGGSRFQIGGPAGAFIVLIFSVVQRQGYDGLVLATMMVGVIMMAVGFMRWGTYIKYIPYPVTVGFTTGIAVIIMASQLKELLGLNIAHEPAALLSKLSALWNASGTISPETVCVSVLAVAIILVVRRLRPTWPGMLIAVVVCSALAGLAHLNVATIGSRFGGVPHSLPAPSLPIFDLTKMRALLPDAFSIALLGSIEFLLSAVVADGMSGRRHRSNCELVAQGVANIAAVIFGGMPVTGTIARTATNVRTGVRSPVSGMLHSVYVLVFMLAGASLASFIALAALAAVLAIVAWNMAEKAEFVALVRSNRGDALVLLSTFLLTVFADLALGIAVGVTLGAFLFLHRMAVAVEVQTGEHLIADDRADDYAEGRVVYDADAASNTNFMVYKISGAFFFGATSTVSAALDRIGAYPQTFVFDFTEVPLVDATAARALAVFVLKLQRAGTRVGIAGAKLAVRSALSGVGVHEPLAFFTSTVAEARGPP
jgi:SulP family sulfate permease